MRRSSSAAMVRAFSIRSPSRCQSKNPYTEPEPMQEPEGKVPIFEIEAEFVAWLAANPPERSAPQSRPLTPRYVQEYDPHDCALPIEQSDLAIPGATHSLGAVTTPPIMTHLT